MLKKEYSYYLELLRCCLNNSAPSLPPENLEWNDLLDVADSTGTEGLLFSPLSKLSGNIVPQNIILEAEKQEALAKYQEAIQYFSGKSVMDRFEKEGIDYSPLKGWQFRSIYPKPYYRSMSDIDIFTHEKDRKLIQNVLKDIGFRYRGHTSVHDIYGNDAGVNLEIHQSLLSEHSRDKNIFRDPWQRMHKVSGTLHMWQFSPEDTYLYLILHSEKHFNQSGLGPRSVMDTAVLLSNYPTLDLKNACLELNDSELRGFSKTMIDLAFLWFLGREVSPVSEELQKYIIESGIHGFQNEHVLQRLPSRKPRNPRIYLFMDRLFPPKEWLQIDEPILKRVPLLMPFCLLHRNIKIICKWGKNIQGEIRNINHLDTDSIDMHYRLMDEIYHRHENK